MEKEKIKSLLDIEKSTRTYLYAQNAKVQHRDTDGKFQFLLKKIHLI